MSLRCASKRTNKGWHNWLLHLFMPKKTSNIIQLSIFQELKKHISARGKGNKPCILNVKIMNRNMFTGIGNTLVFIAHVWRNGWQVFCEPCTLAISLLAFAIILQEVVFFFLSQRLLTMEVEMSKLCGPCLLSVSQKSKITERTYLLALKQKAFVTSTFLFTLILTSQWR